MATRKQLDRLRIQKVVLLGTVTGMLEQAFGVRNGNLSSVAGKLLSEGFGSGVDVFALGQDLVVQSGDVRRGWGDGCSCEKERVGSG